jgi:hypothetical protein
MFLSLISSMERQDVYNLYNGTILLFCLDSSQCIHTPDEEKQTAKQQSKKKTTAEKKLMFFILFYTKTSTAKHNLK